MNDVPSPITRRRKFICGLRTAVVALAVLCAGCAHGTASPTDRSSPGDRPSPADTPTPGFMTPVNSWDQGFAKATTADCVKEGEPVDGGPMNAWRVSDGVLACSMDDANADTPMARHVNDVNLYFDPPIPESSAIASITKLLPADTQQIQSVEGRNEPTSTYPAGTCWQMYYTSATVATTVHQLDPDWTSPQYVRITLASGNIAGNGSDTPYQNGSVHVAFIQQGGENHSPDDTPRC
jgi:hypothetical protein